MTDEEALSYGKDLLTMVSGGCLEFVEKAIEALEFQKDLVRCGDCKYCTKWHGKLENVHVCRLAGYAIGANGFCLYGEKEEK